MEQIDRRSERNGVLFCDIDKGECFQINRSDNELYMKLAFPIGPKNIVNLFTGVATHIGPMASILPVKVINVMLDPGIAIEDAIVQ